MSTDNVSCRALASRNPNSCSSLLRRKLYFDDSLELKGIMWKQDAVYSLSGRHRFTATTTRSKLESCPYVEGMELVQIIPTVWEKLNDFHTVMLSLYWTSFS